MINFAEIIRHLDSAVNSDLRALGVHIDTLVSQRDEALRELREAREEAASLRRELAATREELKKSRLDTEFLTLSRRLAASPQALAEARSTVRGMLARVDRALALLRDDPRI